MVLAKEMGSSSAVLVAMASEMHHPVLTATHIQPIGQRVASIAVVRNGKQAQA